MQAFVTVRLAVFGIILVFGLVILGIGANFVALSSGVRGYYGAVSSIPAFAVATAVLTFAIIIPVLVLDHLRKGAMTSLTASELGFMGFLWILWLACAGNATSFLGAYTSIGCDLLYSSATATSYCHQYQALQAFAWLGWLVIFFYWVALLAMTLIAQSRGVNNAFMIPSTELYTNFPKSTHAGGEPKIPPSNYGPGGVTPGTYPPQGQYPQQTYTPAPMASQGHGFQPSYASSPAPPPPNTIHV